MKEKTKKRIANFSIIGVLAISTVAGMGYAKYITKITGTGTLPVAKWSFLVNGQKDSFGTLDLGRKSYNAETLSATKIAPGTSGSFNIEINAKNTETAVDYKVEFSNIQNKPDNLYFTVGDSTTKLKDFTELANALKGRIKAGETGTVKTIKVNWTWDYETTWNGKTLAVNDAKDTEQGEAAKTMSFNVAVTGTQVEPQAQS